MHTLTPQPRHPPTRETRPSPRSLPQLPPGVFSLGDIYSAPPVAATAGVLCASILRARSVLGGFGDVPPLATPVSAACVTAFCTAAGCAYADDAPATVFLEWLAIELQALRMALASKSRAARAAVSGTRAESLENELTSLARALSIPPPRADVAANQPDKVLAQVSLCGASAACVCFSRALGSRTPASAPPSLSADQGQAGPAGGAPPSRIL